ncbi:MAG: VWA domain-containing protein [Lentisphaerae bacterium]|nr:VWA domain-containing protein [Lentisphaerota bacterium]
MFRFADPYYYLMLAPIGIAFWFVYRRRIRTAIPYPAIFRLSSTHTTWRIKAATILPALYLLGAVLSVIALARPQTVFSKMRRTTDAIAINMVVDVSGSMEALDLSHQSPTGVKYKTRLDVVKETFADFVDKRPDDLIGLVVFGGYASTLCPLTMDHDALRHVLSGVEIPKPVYDGKNQVMNQEELLTAIGDALTTACARLQNAAPKSKIIVLLSDGESNTGIVEPTAAIKVAKELGIKIYTIGVGSTGRAPFMVRDLFGRETIQYAHVNLDEKLLTEIASVTGGKYFNVNNSKGLEEALANIDTLEKTAVEENIYNQYNELFHWFLGPAIGLIVLASSINVALVRRII